MKKNSEENKRPVEIDPISGDYFVRIPEWVVNDLCWYEDTEIIFNLDGQDVILSEHKN